MSAKKAEPAESVYSRLLQRAKQGPLPKFKDYVPSSTDRIPIPPAATEREKIPWVGKAAWAHAVTHTTSAMRIGSVQILEDVRNALQSGGVVKEIVVKTSTLPKKQESLYELMWSGQYAAETWAKAIIRTLCAEFVIQEAPDSDAVENHSTDTTASQEAIDDMIQPLQDMIDYSAGLSAAGNGGSMSDVDFVLPWEAMPELMPLAVTDT